MKVADYEFKGVDQELVDFKDDVITLLNYGKYQPQVLSAAPNWTGKRGEFAWAFSGTTGVLYVFTATTGTTWTAALVFAI